MSERIVPDEVVIDGVRFVQATRSSLNMQTFLDGLACQYHTRESLEANGGVNALDLRVIVASDFEDDEGETFQQLAERLHKEGFA